MRRTEQLQGLRLMKFEDVYGRCYRGDLSQAEASDAKPTCRLSLAQTINMAGQPNAQI